MAATQSGTGSLTVGTQATGAAVVIAIPANAVVESYTTGPGGSPDFEDYQDEDGAFHTRITYESGMTTATVVIFGAPYTSKAAGVAGDGSDTSYYIESVQTEYTKGPVRSTITATLLPTMT